MDCECILNLVHVPVYGTVKRRCYALLQPAAAKSPARPAYSSAAGFLPIIEAFAESIVAQGLAMQPSNSEFIDFVREKFEQAANEGEAPALVTSPDIWRFVRGIVECFRAEGSVFVQSEIHSGAGLKTVTSS
jgi:flagellar biosynthesis protein FlhA